MASSERSSLPDAALSSTTTDTSTNELGTSLQPPSQFSSDTGAITSTITEPSLSTSPLSSPPVATVSPSSPESIKPDPSTSLGDSQGESKTTLVSADNVGPIVAGSVSGLIVLIVLLVFWVRYRAKITSWLCRRTPTASASPPPQKRNGDKNRDSGVRGATARHSSQGLMSQPFQLATIATGTTGPPHVPPSPSSSHHLTAEKPSHQEMTTHADPLGVGLWRCRSSDDIERGGRSSGEGLGGERRTTIGLNDSQTRLIAPPSPPQTPQKAAARHSTPITPTRTDTDLRQSLLSRPLSLQIPLPGRSFSFSRDKKDPPSSAVRPVFPVEPPTPSSSKSIIPSLPTAISPLGSLHPTIATNLPASTNNNGTTPSSPFASISPTSPDRPSTRESVLSGTSSSSRSGYFSGASIRTADLFYHPYPGAMTPASLGLGTSPSRAASILGGMGTPGAGGSGGSRPNSSRQGSNGSRPGSRFSALVGSALGVQKYGSDGTPTPSTRRGSDASSPAGPASENGHGSSGSERRRSTRHSANGVGYLPRPSTTGSVDINNGFSLSSSPSEFGALSSLGGGNGGSPGSAYAWSLKSRSTNTFSPPSHSETLPPAGLDPRPNLRHSVSDSRLLSSPPSSFVPIPPYQQQLSASDLLDPSYLSSSTATIAGGSGSTVNVATATVMRPDPIVEEDTTVLHSANPLLLNEKDDAGGWARSSDESYIDFTDDRDDDGAGGAGAGADATLNSGSPAGAATR